MLCRTTATSARRLCAAARPVQRAATAAPRPLAPARTLHATTPRLSLSNIFETPENPPLAVSRLDERGFQLSDGLLVRGGVVFTDGRAFLWDVDPPGDGSQGVAKAWKGWSKDQFAIFERVVPRPEILILGTGPHVVPPPREIRDYISSLGIQLDIMDSRNASSTYNMLFEEGRTISAALCPLAPVDPRNGEPR